MSYFEIVSLLLLVTACAGFINYRWLHMPRAIGLLVISLLLSLIVGLIGHIGELTSLRTAIAHTLTAANLPKLLFDGVLSFLLFAGALHVNLKQLRHHAPTVLALATIGVLLATAMYGFGMRALFGLAGTDVPLTWCLVLGAILAPTDPIAVTGLLREAGLPEGLLSVITGESMFNDGVAVVVFSVLLSVAVAPSSHAPSLGEVALEFLREGGGGALLGLVTGLITFGAMRLVDEYNLELTISLALVTVTYSIAEQFGMSGPIAVVVAGVLIGNQATAYAMSDTTRTNLTLFWSLIDELLNALLFLLIGLETLTLDLSHLWPGMMAGGILLALLVRLVSAGILAVPLNLRRLQGGRGVAVLTWGGLRGGISAALALSLPDGAYRAPLLQVCYAVVVFTIVVQGLTMPKLVHRLYGAAVRPQRPEQAHDQAANKAPKAKRRVTRRR